jgi:tRNA A37 methylthiotransferase MiaB
MVFAETPPLYMTEKENTMRRVYIDTNDYCEEASLDTQKLKNFIRKTDSVIVNKVEQADLIIFYACGHLKRHEIDSVKIMKKILARKKPGL